MNNTANIYRFVSIIGFILLLFSLFFMPFRIERLLEKRADIIYERETKEAMAQFQSEEHRLLKDQMNDLNEAVSQTNNQITSLINHSSAINDSINRLMTRAVNEPHLLDTIQELYSSGILAAEIKIDSLNHLFSERSTRLIEKIRVFNQKDRDLKIIQSGLRSKKLKQDFLTTSLLVQIGVIAITLIGGLWLFLMGLFRWKKKLQNNPES